jgi:hypothetical protein
LSASGNEKTSEQGESEARGLGGKEGHAGLLDTDGMIRPLGKQQPGALRILRNRNNLVSRTPF